MNALPLRDPDGVIRAWCCGVCFHVGAGSAYLAENADAEIVDRWRERAARCCSCESCSGPAPRSESKYLLNNCDACAELAIAEEKVRRERIVGEPTTTCPTCNGRPDYFGDRIDADGDKTCTRCKHRGYVLASSVAVGTTEPTRG